MKKIFVSVALFMLALPSFAGDCVYSIKSNYSLVPKFRTATPNSDLWRAFSAGTAAANGRLSISSTPTFRRSFSPLSYLDPYIVDINGNSYVLVKDRNDDNWQVENILGHDDTKADLFASLKKLETDGDATKISTEELRKSNIRFVFLNQDQSLALDEREKDFDLSKVKYIDMKNLRTALGNKNQDGTFGYFYVVIEENSKKRAVPGRVTFEEKQELQKYIN